MNPLTARYLKDLNNDVYRMIERLVKNGDFIDCGKLQLKKGPPETVLSSWNVQKKLRKHELGLTAWIASHGLLDFPILRGPHVDQRRLPDATMSNLDIEFDTGTESLETGKRP